MTPVCLLPAVYHCDGSGAPQYVALVYQWLVVVEVKSRGGSGLSISSLSCAACPSRLSQRFFVRNASETSACFVLSQGEDAARLPPARRVVAEHDVAQRRDGV